MKFDQLVPSLTKTARIHHAREAFSGLTSIQVADALRESFNASDYLQQEVSDLPTRNAPFFFSVLDLPGILFNFSKPDTLQVCYEGEELIAYRGDDEVLNLWGQLVCRVYAEFRRELDDAELIRTLNLSSIQGPKNTYDLSDILR